MDPNPVLLSKMPELQQPVQPRSQSIDLSLRNNNNGYPNTHHCVETRPLDQVLHVVGI